MDSDSIGDSERELGAAALRDAAVELAFRPQDGDAAAVKCWPFIPIEVDDDGKGRLFPWIYDVELPDNVTHCTNSAVDEASFCP